MGAATAAVMVVAAAVAVTVVVATAAATEVVATAGLAARAVAKVETAAGRGSYRSIRCSRKLARSVSPST